MELINPWVPRSAPKTKCGQKSGILKIIMVDGRPIIQVKFQKRQKAHLHTPKGCASKIKEIHPWVSEVCSGNEMRTDRRGLDIRGDANTPPHQPRRAGDKNDTKIIHPPPPSSLIIRIYIFVSVSLFFHIENKWHKV